ncbi:MAG: invasion associated locus B family protein [Rubellimicrobium sp.]|nr:invasion associated locus B family protein [Rubellimicrobium sp.]
MHTSLKLISAVALIALSAPALAQEDAIDAPLAPEDILGLTLGEVVDDGTLRPGQAFTREEFGDWLLRCLHDPDGPDPCQLYQLLEDDDGNPVAEISMFPLPDGGRAAAGATIVAPLETLLPEQITISVDGGAARRYAFTFCNIGGCVARVGFTPEEVDQFKAGRTATMRVVPAAAPDQEVVLTISLSGFTAGFTSVGEQEPQ